MAKVTGGEKFSAKLREMARSVENAASVKIGFMGDATERKSGISTALVAIFNEYGVPAHHQPPRPFFRGMIESNAHKWPEMACALLQKHAFDAHKTLDDLGEEIAAELHDAMVDYKGPMLAPSTIARKGFDKQLVDTGDMLNSIRHVVEDKQ